MLARDRRVITIKLLCVFAVLTSQTLAFFRRRVRGAPLSAPKCGSPGFHDLDETIKR